MDISFSIWLQQHEFHEALAKQYAKPDIQTILDADSLENDKKLGIIHYIINKPKSFLSDVIKIPTEKQKAKGITHTIKKTKVDPEPYRPQPIQDITGNVVTFSEPTSSGIRLLKTPLSALKDVTDSVLQPFGQKAKYHINTVGRNPQYTSEIEDLYQIWLKLNRHQLTPNQDDRQIMAIQSLIGGNDMVKQSINKLADKPKENYWYDLAQKALLGIDVTSEAKNAAMDEDKGTSKFYDEKFLRYLQRIDAIAVYDQMRLMDKIGDLSKDEKSLIETMKQINSTLPENLDLIMKFDPKNKPIVDHPQSAYYAKLLGLKNIAQWLQDNQEHLSFISKVKAIPLTPKTEPKPPSDFEKLFQND